LDFSFSAGGKGDKDVKKEIKKTIAGNLDFMKKKVLNLMYSKNQKELPK
jgi:hypothetical protein